MATESYIQGFICTRFPDVVPHMPPVTMSSSNTQPLLSVLNKSFQKRPAKIWTIRTDEYSSDVTGVKSFSLSVLSNIIPNKGLALWSRYLALLDIISISPTPNSKDFKEQNLHQGSCGTRSPPAYYTCSWNCILVGHYHSFVVFNANISSIVHGMQQLSWHTYANKLPMSWDYICRGFARTACRVQNTIATTPLRVRDVIVACDVCTQYWF